jgi:hypothetical protein
MVFPMARDVGDFEVSRCLSDAPISRCPDPDQCLSVFISGKLLFFLCVPSWPLWLDFIPTFPKNISSPFSGINFSLLGSTYRKNAAHRHRIHK